MNTEQLAAHFERVTHGFTPEKKAAVHLEVRRAIARTSPLRLGMALQPGVVQRPPHLALIDDELVRVQQGHTKRLMVSLGSQHGKSETASVWNVLWRLWLNPDLRVVIASYEVGLARKMAADIRDLILAHGTTAPDKGGTDFLGITVDRARGAAGSWRVDGHKGGVYAVGTRGALTGRAVDLLILDDPIKGLAEADSDRNRETVWDFWTATARTRLGADSQVIVIGTRWHEDDTIGRLQAADEALPPERRQWTILNIPIIAGDTDPLGRAPGEYLTGDVRGRGPADYQQLRTDVGERVWAALYQGHPTPATGGIFQWDWILPHRVLAPPPFTRLVVAVDPTAGGHDEAGIVVAGRGHDRRTYVVDDRSGHYTAAQQWRQAWLAVVDHQADALVYEKNLVGPIMAKAVPAAWQRMREQAQLLDASGITLMDPDDRDEDIFDERLQRAAHDAAGAGDDDVRSAADPSEALLEQLRELIPYVERILDAPESGPARVQKVSATQGKRTRAEPTSQAYETGRVSHVGLFPALEHQMVTWQEGQDSPDRVDALVWAHFALDVGSQPGRVASAAGRTRVATGAAAVTRTGARTRSR